MKQVIQTTRADTAARAPGVDERRRLQGRAALYRLAEQVGAPTSVVFIVVFIAVLLAYTILLRLPALKPDRVIPSDTIAFLDVARLLNGAPPTQQIPFRIEYPLYPYLIFCLQAFWPDPLTAARIAAFLPSLLTPLVVFVIGWILERRVSSAMLAFFCAASSPALMDAAMMPLSDALFILLSALTVLAQLMLLRRPSLVSAASAGAAAGLAWAARGPGAWFPIALLGAFLTPNLAASEHKGSNAESAANVVRRRGFYFSVSLVMFLLCGLGPRIPLYLLTRNRTPDPNQCVKQVIADGSLYARGVDYRDSRVYRLNQDCTTLASAELRLCELTWYDFVSRYGPDQIVAFALNMKRLVRRELTEILSPFAVLFLPLAIGVIHAASAQPLRVKLLGALFVFPFLVIIPAIQFQPRYLYPILIPATVVTGIGLSSMLRGDWLARSPHKSCGPILGCVVVGLVGVIAIDAARSSQGDPSVWASYRKACEWIKAEGRPDVKVMSRYYGASVYLEDGRRLNLPSDSPERVGRYCLNTNTRYILWGPLEARHNRALERMMEVGTEVGIAGAVLTVTRTFEHVKVIEIRRN